MNEPPHLLGFALRRAICFTALLIAAITVVSAPARGDALQTTSPINLAYLLPAQQPIDTQVASSDSPSSASRIATDVGVAAVGSLIASDDNGIYRTVQGPNGPSPGERRVAGDISDLGNLEYVAPALGLVYLTGGSQNRDIAWRSSVALIRAGIIGDALKAVIGRRRPQGSAGGSADTFRPLHPAEKYDSFPSGHTLVAFSVATVWADERPSARYEAFSLASLVAASRIVKGAHWPSDVFWGAIIGYTQAREAVRGNVNLLNFRF
jgi:hypothetical protein